MRKLNLIRRENRNKLINDPAEHFRFDYQARFQRISKTYIEDELDLIDFMHWRNRFRVSYNVRKNPIEPSAYVEFFTPLNGYKQELVDEIRYGADVSYPIAKNQSISGGIILFNEQFETGLSGIIFTLGYKITVL